jgi:hypothetical protein
LRSSWYLMIGQRLEGFAEADAVGNDAAAEALQLVDGADDAVALELVELLPDHRVANAGGGLDDALFVHASALMRSTSRALASGCSFKLAHWASNHWLSICASAGVSEA